MGWMAPFAFWLGYRYSPAWKCFLTAKCACYRECAAATLLQIHPSAFQHAQNSSNSYEFPRSLLPAWDSSGIQLHRLNSFWSVHHPHSHHWTNQPHSVSPPTESLFITQSIHYTYTICSPARHRVLCKMIWGTERAVEEQNWRLVIWFFSHNSSEHAQTSGWVCWTRYTRQK